MVDIYIYLDLIGFIIQHSHDGSMVLLYMVTFTINTPAMLAYIPAPWIRHGTNTT